MNANIGHGHVYPRPDGVKARCGGPAICRVCQEEQLAIITEQTELSNRLLTDIVERVAQATISVKEFALIEKYVKLGRSVAEFNLTTEPNPVIDAELNELHSIMKRVGGVAVNLVLQRESDNGSKAQN